jgi:hypothetical protein
VTHPRLRKLSAVVGWLLYLVAGVGLWLGWDFGVWLLTGAALLAIQWSRGFRRPEWARAQKGPEPAEKVLGWYPKWW